MNATAKKVLVKCVDYNGHKDILFTMSPSDFRYNDGNYQHFATGTLKARVFRADDGKTYKVFSDGSAKAA